MISTAYAGVAFSAAHQVGEGRCSKHHGHVWRIQAAFQDRKGDPIDTDGTLASLHEIRSELHLRDLNSMIKPSIPDAEGLARWVMERLLQQWPVIEVMVWQDEEVGVRLSR